ncbi:putative membrane protein [Erysiphe neolycopersici]|uniref:Putative membrane protein n=1 Tax=Erysiphe neolycopersici TaxID=212602 RepID=A0A420HT24_9PEZI|nr:putative membrane protein [Erysiphe neolycopersici]
MMTKIIRATINQLFSRLSFRRKAGQLVTLSSLATRARRPYITSPSCHQMSLGAHLSIVALILSLWVFPVSAVFVDFRNCLSERTLHDQPLALQLVPQYVNVIFNTTSSDHRLNVTVWVNVTGSTAGSAPRLVLPPADDTNYWNSNNSTESGGKIEAIPSPDKINKQTTLYNSINFLNYKQFHEYVSFCDHIVNGACPLGPVWNRHILPTNEPEIFPHFGFSYNPYSTYALASLAALLKVNYGDKEASEIGCISIIITPEISTKLAGVVKFTPALILFSVGVSVLFAAIWSPWGSSDIFRWTTNYGRDPDLLRLITPGFGDCLQYIQFVVLTAGLKIDYPGFYQPIVSKLAWSILTFNYSFFQNSNRTTTSLIDGIYDTHGTYGLEKLSQLIGIAQTENLWNSMVISLLAIIAMSLMTIQVGFIMRWTNRKLNDIQEEDLRAKNMPFSIGNVIRIIFNYFLFPLVALSMFQLAVASKSPTHTVGLALLLLFFIVGLSIWLLNVIISTRRKSFLFDDFRTVLIFGSLYCTYSDHATSFAAIPIALTFVRGVAIGAIQASGIAQLVLLAVCEIITILTIHGFRPYQSYTSMNAYQISFSAIRFISLLLMISFAPSLDVIEGSKGWIGYAILLMHSIVLILGFLLNAIQRILEVSARLACIADEVDQARGVFADTFCMRQLSRRQYDPTSRQSQLSNVAMLDSNHGNYNGRIRSQSAGSAGILIGKQSLIADHSNLDKFASHQQASSRPNYRSLSISRDAYAFSNLLSISAPSGLGQSRAPSIVLDTSTQIDPYYRPPRHRQLPSDSLSTGVKSKLLWNGDKWTDEDFPDDPFDPAGETSLKSGRTSPHLELNQNPVQSKADYTTREVDLYYGVRSSASHINVPNRRMAAPPTNSSGPNTSPTGWFKWITGNKTKEKGKGFEVIRNSRPPPEVHRSIGS